MMVLKLIHPLGRNYEATNQSVNHATARTVDVRSHTVYPTVSILQKGRSSLVDIAYEGMGAVVVQIAAI